MVKTSKNTSKNVKKYCEAVFFHRGLAKIIAAETGYKVGTVRAMLSGYRTRPYKVEVRVKHYQDLLLNGK